MKNSIWSVQKNSLIVSILAGTHKSTVGVQSLFPFIEKKKSAMQMPAPTPEGKL